METNFICVNQYGTKVNTEDIVACSVGGICGKVENTIIQNCQNDSDITGIKNGACIGGIVGCDRSSNEEKISNCVNDGKISIGSRLGGIVGLAVGNITIENCNNKGVISSPNNIIIGGIAGQNYGEIKRGRDGFGNQ